MDSRSRADLIGSQAFWTAALLTLGALLASAFLRSGRAWIGCAVLLMWSGFSMTNAIRARRIHSLISGPVYLLAAIALAGSASGLIDVPIWIVWVLGAGLIAANLSERVFGKYLA